GTARRRARARGRHQQGFLLTGELALRAGTRLFAQRSLQVAFDKAPLGPVDGRESRSRKSGQGGKWNFCLTAGTLWPANQEIYADDADHPGATPEQIQRARTPYTITEQNFTIRALQPRGANRHAVFFTHAREAISYHYERNPADPRIQHALTLEVD